MCTALRIDDKVYHRGSQLVNLSYYSADNLPTWTNF